MTHVPDTSITNESLLILHALGVRMGNIPSH